MVRISVFIPCTPAHCKYLPGVIAAYLCGTQKPDEIVVVLSGVKDIRYLDLRDVEDRIRCSYSCKFIKVQEPMRPGPVRQMAKGLCTGDVIVYQDADDMPHSQRVEVVGRYFNGKDIVHLNHSYVVLGAPQSVIGPIREWGAEEIYRRYFPHGQLGDCLCVSPVYGSFIEPIPVHSGACCIRREVLDGVSWKDNSELTLVYEEKHRYHWGEDYQFCMEVAHRYRRSMIIDAPLYAYRRS